VFFGDIIEFGSNGNWDAEQLTSAIQEGDLLPTAQLTRKIAPVDADEAVTIPLNFKLKALVKEANDAVILNVTVVGTGNSTSTAKSLKVLDVCTPIIESNVASEVGAAELIPGSSFFHTAEVFAESGKPFTPAITVDLGFLFVVRSFDNDCDTEVYDNVRVLCEDPVFNNNSLGSLYLQPTEEAGCVIKPKQYLKCTPKEKVSVDNKVEIRNLLEVDKRLFDLLPFGDQLKKTLKLVTSYNASICENTADTTEVIVRAPNSLYVAPTDSLQWWIVVVAVVGALLLGIIIALVLWKAGFFKRSKPPVEDTSNGLDEEVQGGSVLRG